MNYLEELLQLKNNGIHTINQIEWWLLKYSNAYKNILRSVESKNEEFELEDGSIVNLPPLEEPLSKSDQNFISLYQALDTLTKFHKDEKYFEEEMIEYHKIKESHLKLKNWVFKNEHLGSERFVCFLVDYLDYSENAEHLLVYVYTSPELKIYIDQKYFKNTIEFLEIFNELYFMQNILHESIEKILIDAK